MAEVSALQSLTVRLPDKGERAFRHRGTPADIGVVAQMFETQDYSLGRLRRGAEVHALYDALLDAGRRPLILDAGANIGASAVYFGVHFPRAHIVALEPEAGNFELLRANTAGMDVDARCAAIGARDGAAGDVPVQAAARLVAEKLAAGHAPYIAKIDIGGGEQELFAADTGWADAFPLLIIELYDWLMPRSGGARNFLRWAAEHDRDFVHVGEHIFSIANDWTAAPIRA